MDNKNWLITSAGVKMPRMIYGTAWKKERTGDLVRQAIKAGFRGIDTAGQPKHYNEPLIGEALKMLQIEGLDREELFLQTKFTPLSGQDPDNIPYKEDASPDKQVEQSFESSLKNLQTMFIDSYVLHSPISPMESLMEIWKAFEKLQQEERIGQLGISNCYNLEVLKALYECAEVKPAVLQNRFYRQTGYDKQLRRWCLDHGIVYQSFWSLTANPHILLSSEVQEIAQEYGKTSEQIFYRYLSQSNIVPLNGTTSLQHMKEDLSIFNFQLKNEELKEIDSLLL